MSESSSGPDILDQLANEFAERYRKGERPSLTEYIARYPDQADQIRELFPALAVMEEFGSVGGRATGPSPQSNREESVPQQLDEYRILREVARGGMGIVYEAVQESLGRHVALKVLPFQKQFHGNQLERFRREARAAANLHHSNIVPVFGVGEHDGVHYYAMQFIQGQALDSILREIKHLRNKPGSPARVEMAIPLQMHGESLTASLAEGILTGKYQHSPKHQIGPEPPTLTNSLASSPLASDIINSSGKTTATRVGFNTTVPDNRSELTAQPEQQYFHSVARMGTQVAEGLAYAHGQGILHRDIKPGNLLLDTQGTVWISDFGLAKAEGTDDLTNPGDIVGTLRYMAPERFSGISDPRSDIYSLGLTLYEMLTLSPAYEESDRARLIKRIMEETPVRPRKINPQIPQDLETICLKCLEKDPNRRYAMAREVAEELRRFRQGEPIKARSITGPERLWRWCKRYPAVATLAGLVILILLAGTGISSYFAFEAESRAWEAKLAKDETDEAKQVIEKTLEKVQKQERAAIAAENKAKEEKNNAEKLATEKSQTVEALNEYLYLADLRTVQSAVDEGNIEQAVSLLMKYRPIRGELDRRSFSWYYLRHLCRHSEGNLFGSGPKGTFFEIGHRGVNFALSPNGKFMAMGGHDSKEIHILDANTGREVKKAKTQGSPQQLSFTPDGNTLVVACAISIGNTAKMWDKLYELQGIFLYDLTQEKMEPVALALEEKIGRCLAISPTDPVLACAGSNGTIELWNYTTLKQLDRWKAHSKNVDALHFSRDGSELFSTMYGEKVCAWKLKKKAWGQVGFAKQGFTMKIHANPHAFRDTYFHASFWRCQPASLALSPDGRILAAASNGPTIQLFDSTRKTIRELVGHADTISSLAFSKDGKFVISASHDRDLRLWDVTTGAEKMRLGGHHDIINMVAVTPDGKYVFSAGDDLTIRKWKLPDANEPPEVLKGSPSLIYSLAISPNGKQIACGGWHWTIPIRDIETGTLVKSFTGFKSRIHSMVFSRDQKNLICGHADEQSLVLWDLETGQKKLQLPGEGYLYRVSVPDKGNPVAYGNYEKTWVADLEAGIIRTLPGGDPTFSPDGELLITQNKDGLTLWNARTYQPTKKIHAGYVLVRNSTFSAGGRLLAFMESQKVIAVWDLKKHVLLHRLEGHLSQVGALAFCPDGKTLVAAEGSGNVILWDLITGQRQIVLRGHHASVTALAFNPDGNLLSSGGLDKDIRFWRAPGLPRVPAIQADNETVARAESFQRTKLKKGTP